MSGKLIAVWSPKGGVGKSLLATAIAVKLAERQRTLLIDGNADNPDLVGILQCPGYPNVSTWPEAVTPETMATAVVPFQERLWVIPGPQRFVEADTLTGSVMESILDAARAGNLLTVVDLGSPLRDSTVAALDRVDTILLPVTLDLLAIAPLRRLSKELDLLRLPRTKFQVVINRQTPTREITIEDVRTALNLPIAAVLPSSKELAAAVNRGELLKALTGNSLFARGVAELTAALTGLDSGAVRRTSFRWIARAARRGEA